MVAKHTLFQKLICVLLCFCIIIGPGFNEDNAVHADAAVAAMTMACGTSLGPAAAVIAVVLAGAGVGIAVANHKDAIVSFWNSLTSSQQKEISDAGNAAAASAGNNATTYQYAPSQSVVDATSSWISTHASSATASTIRKAGYISPSTDTWTIGTTYTTQDSYIKMTPVQLADDLWFMLIIRNIGYSMGVFSNFSVDGVHWLSWGATLGLGGFKNAVGNSIGVTYSSNKADWDSLMQGCTISLRPISTYNKTYGVTVTTSTGAKVTFHDEIKFDQATASMSERSYVYTDSDISVTTHNADAAAAPTFSTSINPTYVPTGTFTGTAYEQDYQDYIDSSVIGAAQPLVADYPLDIPVPGDWDYNDEEEYVTDIVITGVGVRDYDYPIGSDTPIVGPISGTGSISIDWPQDIATDHTIDDTAGGDGASDALPWVFRIPILGQILKAIKALWDLLKAGFNKILEFFQTLINSIAGFFDAIWNKIANFWRGIPDAIRNILDVLRNILNAIAGFIFDLGDYLAGILAFITGYTLFQNLLTHFLPASVATVMWAMWLCAIAIWLLRMLLNR